MNTEKTTPVTAIVLGASGRGKLYGDYSLEHPDDLRITGIAELVELRRNIYGDKYHVPKENRAATWEELLSRPKFADAVIIATPDHLHYAPCMSALDLGYDILLEKPIAQTDEECRRLVAYARSVEKERGKNFRFTLTTNGMLIDDDVIDFANREMSNVVLSLDGRKDVNDKMRPFRNGSGSYDLIVPKFQKFADSRKQMNYYVRGTFTRNNLDFADDVLHYADLGFEQMSMEPVVADPSEDYAIKEEDIPAILKEYDRLALEYIKRKKEGRGFNFFHFMLDLKAGPCVAKRMAGCGSGTEYLAVTPWGDLYPCHQFVGNEKFLMGNVDTGVVNTDIRDEFKTCNVYAKPGCKDCFARFYCSGGCSANAYNFSGSINGAYDIGCEMQKKRIECAIMIKAALADDEE